MQKNQPIDTRPIGRRFITWMAVIAIIIAVAAFGWQRITAHAMTVPPRAPQVIDIGNHYLPAAVYITKNGYAVYESRPILRDPRSLNAKVSRYTTAGDVIATQPASKLDHAIPRTSSDRPQGFVTTPSSKLSAYLSGPDDSILQPKFVVIQENSRVQQRFWNNLDVTSLVITPTMYIVGGKDGSVEVHSITTGQRLFQTQSENPTGQGVTLSCPDEHHVLIAWGDEWAKVDLDNLPAATAIHTTKLTPAVGQRVEKFSPDGNLARIDSAGNLSLINASGKMAWTKQLMPILADDQISVAGYHYHYYVRPLDISSDRVIIAEPNGSATVYAITTGKALLALPGIENGQAPLS